ncbi:MAG: zinc-ribbon domain-containing protein [Candidatus Thorarchaeota archaeon]
MFCQNCGAELTEPDQKFCQNCGSEIQIEAEIPESEPESVLPPSPTPIQPQPSQPTPAPTQFPTQIGGIGSYSKKSLGFAIASLVTAIITLSIGANLSFFSSYFGFFGLGYGFTIPGMIAVICFHILGLIFGILARTNSSRAVVEPENAASKIGGVFGVFGIILNVIPMALALILPAALFIPSFPYF